MRFEPLPREFYAPSARTVGPRLLGHYLVRQTEGELCAGIIVETEAYLEGDPACHGAPGLTRRNRVMFGEPGYAYVYLIYGMHFCVNAVCRPAGIAEAVLIRAVAPLLGTEQMQARRGAAASRDLTNGPARLCQAMAINRKLDGADLSDGGSPLFIARNPGAAETRSELGPLVTTTRIGITKAASLPLRFYLEGSSAVSKRSNARRR